MNSRERVLTALKRTGKPDKTPFEISWGAFTPKLMKTYREKTLTDLTPEEFFNFDTRFVLPSPTEQNTDFTQFFKNEQLPASVSFDEWGIGSVPTLYEIPDFKYHPLEIMSTVEEIENWPWPDMGEEYRYKFRKQMSYSVEMAVSCWHRHIYWIRRYHRIILWHLLMLPRAYNPFRGNRNYKLPVICKWKDSCSQLQISISIVCTSLTYALNLKKSGIL